VFTTTCNYPEAALDGQYIVENLTVITSTDRTFVDNPSMVYYAGPGNVTTKNLDFTDHYLTVTNPKGTILFPVTSDCQPNDGRLKTIDVHNASYSVTNNPNYQKYSVIFINLRENAYRQINVNLTLQNFSNIQNVPAQWMLWVGSGKEQLAFSSSLVNNSINTEPIIRIVLFRALNIQNLTFSNIPSTHDVPALLLEFNYYVNADSLSFDNVHGTTSSSNAIISLNNLYFTYTYFGSISVRNWNLKLKSLMKNLSTLDSLIIHNGTFSNITLSSGSSLVASGRIKSISFTELKFIEISVSDNTDTSSKILSLETVDLNSTLASLIDSISISNSQTSFLHFGLLVNEPSDSKTIVVSNVKYSDSFFETKRDLIYTGSMESNANLNIVFENVTMSNIEFEVKGNLFNFGHQLPNSVIVANSTFVNLTSCQIIVEASNKQNSELITKTSIKSSSFANIQGKYESLLNINEGGLLEVENCNFTKVSTFEDGAIFYAGYQLSRTIVTGSTFTNNYAFSGSIAITEFQSFIEFYMWDFSNNLGVSSGLVKAVNNGYFKFYDSDIYENYAVSYLFASAFDTAYTSVISNWRIHNNIALSLDSLEVELSTSWDRLCFLDDASKTYLQAYIKTISLSKENEVLYLVLASLSIENNTHIYNESSLFKLYRSSVQLSDR
jgi:hypothetical protein